jgi:hypothetical protein
VFTTLHARLRAHRRPAFPAPSVLRGRNVQAKLGRIAPRDRIALFEI